MSGIPRDQIEAFIKMWLESVEQEKVRTGLPIVRDEKTGDPLYFDQRELRLRYLIPVKRIQRFFEGLQQDQVLYTECKSCGFRFFPPQADCSKCGSTEMEWRPIEGPGKLLTYTVINVKPTSFMHYDDYVVAIARMKEGFNVLAWLKAKDPSQIKIGMDVRLVVERRMPENYLTYAF
ncbi:MAG: Zn-ribbon domain-containing OB-fold protein, partial [Nitrososphaerota archaeon]